MHYYRLPKTTQEHRTNEGHAIEGIRVRAKRGRKLLPGSYDDLARSVEHCWKDHRTTQYKASKAH